MLTNPDMLHFGILPNHKNWNRMLSRLKYVVLDEAHVYRGVFGSHVANILRRLRRVCRLYGSSPQFILCSATIANPKEHAEALVGREFEVVSEDGSPSGNKTFTFWNPPNYRRSPQCPPQHDYRSHIPIYPPRGPGDQDIGLRTDQACC